MASISTILTYVNIFRELFSKEPNATYDVQAKNVLIPKDPTIGITLEFTGELTPPLRYNSLNALHTKPSIQHSIFQPYNNEDDLIASGKEPIHTSPIPEQNFS